MKNFLLCLINTLLMVTGQILFKLGSTGKILNNLSDIIKLFFNPIILVALCIYAFTTSLWLYILSKVPISFAYPIQALAFPIILFVSNILFGENITLSKWIGVVIICIGVYFITR